ncbi:MAG: arginase family protein [Gaiellaceae bacterium]
MEPIAVIGAPSAIGISPYRDGGMRRLDLAPAALREQGLIRRLGARDLGDVLPPPGYADEERPAGRVRNEDDVARYSERLAERVAGAVRDHRFVLLLGGDCSIMLGALLGLKQALGAPVGVAYVDAHADFATRETSVSGSACSMNLALAVGREEGRLASLDGDQALLPGELVAHVARRDDEEPEYGHADLPAYGVLDLAQRLIDERGAAAVADEALARATQARAGFWIHFDVDALDPELMPAVDSPLPNGLDLHTAAELLGPLVSHPEARGLQVTIYDRSLDPEGSAAAVIVDLLERVLTSRRAP